MNDPVSSKINSQDSLQEPTIEMTMQERKWMVRYRGPNCQNTATAVVFNND